MSVFFLGPPCAGKSTISKLVCARTGIRLYSGGDVARKIAEQDESTKMALSKGEMAPEKVMNSAMISMLTEERSHCIIDGYPRYWEQMGDVLRFLPQPYYFVVVHALPERLYARQKKRMRLGDSDEVHENRMRIYVERTLPVIAWLQERKMCINVDNQVDGGHVDILVQQIIEQARL